MINRRDFVISTSIIAASTGLLGCSAEAQASMLVHKSATCGCCNAWIMHMRDAGFQVGARNEDDVTLIKQQHEIPSHLWSCHTAVIDGYVIEGHIPAPQVQRLLAERPSLTGLAVPGMPAGSPGMETSGPNQAYTIYGFGPEGVTIWAEISA
jgi:hypothetical protein